MFHLVRNFPPRKEIKWVVKDKDWFLHPDGSILNEPYYYPCEGYARSAKALHYAARWYKVEPHETLNLRSLIPNLDILPWIQS